MIKQTIAGQFDKVLTGERHGRQKEPVEAADISPSRLNNIIRGRRDDDENIRRAICRYLGRDYDNFLFSRPGNYIVTSEDPNLQAFLDLYRQYGTPAFLRSCTRRLMEVREVVEK